MTIKPSHQVLAERFLREQRIQRKSLVKWMRDTYQRDWVGAKRPNGTKLVQFARNYRQALDDAGAFDFEENFSPDQLRLKFSKTYILNSYTLWPVTLGQFLTSSEAAYSEEFLMYTRVGARIAPNKVVINEAPLCLCWSKHTLERMYERGAAGIDMEAFVTSHARSLMRQLSILASCGLMKASPHDQPLDSSFLPFSGGMLIFTSRYISGQPISEELGWKFRLTGARSSYSTPYLKSDRVLRDFADHYFRAEGRVVFLAWCTATFVEARQISESQRPYLDACQRLIDSLTDEHIDQMTEFQFNPDRNYKSSGAPDVPLTDQQEDLIIRCRELLDDGGFNGPDKSELSYLIEDGITTRDLRAAMTPGVASR